LYGDNQAKMAAATGMSQPQISLVVRGLRAPGKKLLSALARDPRVNALWVLDGTGQPFAEAEQPAPHGGVVLQVMRDVLSGPVADHADLRTGLTLDWTGLVRPTMYLLQVAMYDPIANVPALRIAPGDYLLLETDPARWRANLNLLAGRVCAIRRANVAGGRVVLARVYPAGERGGLAFDTVDPGHAHEAQAQAQWEKEFQERFGPRPRRIAGSRRAPRQPPPVLDVADVVAYCVAVLRL
jgi:hypothetical protein